MFKLLRHFQYLILFAILLLCVFLYSNIFNNGFLLDDYQYFITKPTLNDVSVISLFSQAFKGFYRPFAVGFLKFELFLFGNSNPIGYHLVNLALFCCICWLFFLILYKLFHNYEIALIASCFYAVHPINSFLVNYKTASAINVCILCMQISTLFLFNP